MSSRIGDHILVTGACTEAYCGGFTGIQIGNEEDALVLLNHEHGHVHRHCFKGEITISKVTVPKLIEKAA